MTDSEPRHLIDQLPEDGGVLEWTGWWLSNGPKLLALGLLAIVFLAIEKGGFGGMVTNGR